MAGRPSRRHQREEPDISGHEFLIPCPACPQPDKAVALQSFEYDPETSATIPRSVRLDCFWNVSARPGFSRKFPAIGQKVARAGKISTAEPSTAGLEIDRSHEPGSFTPSVPDSTIVAHGQMD